MEKFLCKPPSLLVQNLCKYDGGQGKNTLEKMCVDMVNCFVRKGVCLGLLL